MERAPHTLLMPYAMPSDGSDPHLRPGIHLRWFNNPILGLPQDPVRIERINIEKNILQHSISDAVFITDRYGQPASLPRTLVAEEQLFVRIPFPDRCLGVDIDWSGGGSAPGTAYAESNKGASGFRPVAQMSLGGWIHGNAFQRVRIQGPITINAIRWIDVEAIEEKLREESIQEIEKVGLPISGGNRYIGTSDAETLADGRVWNGAPLRAGLHDAFNVSGPMAAPIINPDAELDRVRTLAEEGELMQTLNQLINDTSEIPIRLMSRQDMSDGVEGNISLLQSFMFSLLDYGVARWLGFATVDQKAQEAQQNGIFLYRISVQYNFDEVDIDEKDFPETYRTLVKTYLADGSPRIYTYVLVNLATEAQPPRPAPATNWQIEPGAWTTGGADILRQAQIQFRTSPIDLPHQYALRKRKLPAGGSQFQSLNQLDNSGQYRLALYINSPQKARHYRERRYLDLEVSPVSYRYQLALADMFGRWSTWSGAGLPAGSLIPPPAPVIQAEYEMASATPLNDDGRSGQLAVTIPIPGRTTEGGDFIPEPAPGSPFINQVQILMLSMDNAGAETLISTRNFTIGSSMSAFKANLTGPVLGRGQKGIVVLRARFQAGSLLSEEEGVARLQVQDPRSPEALILSPDVQYTTQADSKGIARVKLSWNAAAGHTSFRIFCASQRALEPYLESLGETGTTALETSKNINSSPEALATEIANLPGSIPRNLFTLVTPQAIPSIASGSTTYTAQLPGRSRMLFIFRILAVGASEIEEPWEDGAALQYVAVPSSIRLQPPQVVLEEVADTAGLKVIVKAPGKQRVGKVRIYRSNTSEIPFKQMSLVDEIDMPPVEEGDSPQELVFIDEGPTKASPTIRLLPWRTYTYRAQIQAPEPPGSLAPPPLWSLPGILVSRVNIPPGPPPVPIINEIVRSGDDVLVKWSNQDLPIKATDLGNHFYRVLRVPEIGGVAEEVHRADALLPAMYRDVDAPEGMKYIVQLVDPLGRASQTIGAVPVSITRLDFPLPSTFSL